jgi:hypothetical protein
MCRCLSQWWRPGCDRHLLGVSGAPSNFRTSDENAKPFNGLSAITKRPWELAQPVLKLGRLRYRMGREAKETGSLV